MVGPLPGDQVFPRAALNASGGFLVWQDNASGRPASIINAVHLDASLRGLSPIRVNAVSKGNLQKPSVSLMKNNRTIFVWQGTALGTPDIYFRILGSNGVFVAPDVRINTVVKDAQINPAVSSLGDGAVVVWQSYNQDGNLFGIYGRRVSATGKLVGSEISVNTGKGFNQRNPAVTELAGGNFIVTWITEQQRFENSVDVGGRLFTAAGLPAGPEFLINQGTNICSKPSVAALANGGFTVVWSERDSLSRSNGLDIVARGFSADGTPSAGGAFRVNSFVYGDQYEPSVAAVGNDCLAVWTSMGQDGSWEGVFGRLLTGGTRVGGSEFQINDTTISRQIHGTVAADGTGRFLVNWSSFAAVTSFDLFGKTYRISPPAPQQ